MCQREMGVESGVSMRNGSSVRCVNESSVRCVN